MHDTHSGSASHPDAPAGKPGVRLDRRALLRAGAGASPVLLTLVSNPVAASSGCVVASSFVSVASFKSRNPTTKSISCGARTVEQWKEYCRGHEKAGTVQVKKALGSCNTFGERKLRDMLIDSSSTTGTEGLLRHLAAMYLTLTVPGGLKSSSPGNLTVLHLRDIWAQCKFGGNYTLRASGINWNTAQVIQWLTYQLNYPAAL